MKFYDRSSAEPFFVAFSLLDEGVPSQSMLTSSTGDGCSVSKSVVQCIVILGLLIQCNFEFEFAAKTKFDNFFKC
jgi:hypothetical protein